MDGGDLDNDGDNDIAAIISDTTGGADDIVWYENNGFGSFTKHILNDSREGAIGIVIEDIDGDGFNDIVSVSDEEGAPNNNVILMFVNDGSGGFNGGTIINDSAYRTKSVAAGDMDNDGDIDIVSAASNSGSQDFVANIWVNDGSEVFSNTSIRLNTFATGSGTSVNLDDIDDDGDLDIIMTTHSQDMVFWLENLGGLSFVERIITQDVYESPLNTEIVDLDDDGFKDILISSWQKNPIADAKNMNLIWLRNDGGETFNAITIAENETFGNLLESRLAADFDGDGDIDILTGTRSQLAVQETGISFLGIYINDGLENFNLVNLTNENMGLRDLLFMDVNGDTSEDIIYINNNETGIAGDKIAYFDLLKCPEVTNAQQCNFPSLFCDNFNYAASLSSRNWIVHTSGNSVDNSFAPIDNELTLETDQFLAPFHQTDVFQTSFRPDAGSAFTKHFLSPVFTSEFDLFINDLTGVGQDNFMRYAAYERQNIIAYIIEVEQNFGGNGDGNLDWYYINRSQPSQTRKIICENCSFANTTIHVKIETFFKQRDIFPFNTSNQRDEIRIFISGKNIFSNITVERELDTITEFLNPNTNYLAQYEIIKFDEGNFRIDNYFVMVGTDKNVNTMEQYYTDLFDNRSVVVIDYGGETGDMAQAISDIWGDFGLHSQASKIMAGLFLMFFLAIIMFGLALSQKTTLSPMVLITVELFFMILLVFIKLLPIWLPFVIIIIAAGIGAVLFKMGTQN